MSEQRNLIVAIVASVAILIGWEVWQSVFVKPIPHPMTTQVTAPEKKAAPQAVPAAPAHVVAATPTPNAEAAKPAAAAPVSAAPAPRVRIETPSIKGSLSLRGARIDDITLLKYRETDDPKSPAITLLEHPKGAGAYFAEFGWASTDPSVSLPGPDSIWSASAAVLTPKAPLTLTWDNGHGLRFVRTLAVDDNYMFTIADTVENATGKALSLAPFGLVDRWGTPPTLNYYLLHEGPLGVLDGTLKEVKYKKLREDDHTVTMQSRGGWIGFTDKYWLTALIPDQGTEVTARMSWHEGGGLDRYQTDWTGAGIDVPAGGKAVVRSHFFAGAKELSLLDGYDHTLGVAKFDLAIDFGWFWFLTIPFFKFLRFIHEYVSNFGVAIMIFTVVIRGAFFPIANRSYKAMNKMRQLQPEIKKLQERFKEDRARLNQEMMALYKREKANPVSGCLPTLIQVPVFFALYKVLFVTIEMRHAPFFGWIHDLSAPDPTTIFNLFGLIPWDPPQFLHIGVWALIMGLTMWLQQRLNPQPADPIQARMFMFLPIVFTFLLAKFPAGLVIYWAWSNTLTIAQQWLIMKRMNRQRR